MKTMFPVRLAAWALAWVWLPLVAATIPPGSSRQVADLGGTMIDLYTYRPPQCEPHAWLLVFHGMDRNADQYRDDAKPLADALCVVAVAPLFDPWRFPGPVYQRGGLAAADSGQGSGAYVERLVEWLRAGQPGDWPYAVIGHSAGGQFLGRYAAATPNQACAIVLANPGSYLFPSLQTALPDGFAGLPDAELAMRRYLAEPIVVLLGDNDVQRGKNLPRGYDDEGANRHERGLNFFHAGERVAAERHWAFNWRLLEVPGVAHNARAMFASPQALKALDALRER